MAVIGHGEVLLGGKPDEIEASLNGKVWQKATEKSELKSHSNKYKLISNHFHMGKMMVTVIAEDMPGEEFNKKLPTLEDAYFNLLYDQQKTLAL